MNPAWRQLQRRFKAQKSSACGLGKPWKKGGEDKKTGRRAASFAKHWTPTSS
ncbi:MAG: hypothetical protein WCT12_15195 [Verrucomicrobiota bacterium]